MLAVVYRRAPTGFVRLDRQGADPGSRLADRVPLSLQHGDGQRGPKTASTHNATAAIMVGPPTAPPRGVEAELPPLERLRQALEDCTPRPSSAIPYSQFCG